MYNEKKGKSNPNLDALREKVNKIPAEQIANKFSLLHTVNGKSPQGDCPTGHSSSGGKCFQDKRHFQYIIKDLIKDNYIKENPKPINFTGKGDCGRLKK